MNSTKLYSIVLVTLFGLMVFNSLEYVAGGDEAAGGDFEFTKEDQEEEALQDENAKVEEEKAIQDNAKEEETRQECIKVLRNFKFNGTLIHDAFEVELEDLGENKEEEEENKEEEEENKEEEGSNAEEKKDDNHKCEGDNCATCAETKKEPSKEDKEKELLRKYKKNIAYLVARVVSTETNLLECYCNRLDPLLRLGYTGNYYHDIDNDKKKLPNILEHDKKKYMEFVRLPNTLNYVIAAQHAGIQKINLIYQYTLVFGGIKMQAPSTSTECIAKVKEPGANNADYGKFFDFIKLAEVSASEQFIIVLYCDVVDALRVSGFTGNQDDIDRKLSDENPNPDLSYGYSYFAKLPENRDSKEDLIFKYTLFRLKLKN